MVLGGEADIVVPPQWDSPAEPPVKVYGAGKPNFSLRTFGSGRLYGMGGAAETVGYSPDTSQLLFKFVPGPFDRWTTYDWQPSWVSRGGVTIPTGEAKTHYVPNVVGTGFLPVLAGAAESITFNPEEKQMLFSFTGAVSQTTTVVPPEGFGTLFGFSGASIATRSAYETQGLYQNLSLRPLCQQRRTAFAVRLD